MWRSKHNFVPVKLDFWTWFDKQTFSFCCSFFSYEDDEPVKFEMSEPYVSKKHEETDSAESGTDTGISYFKSQSKHSLRIN